MPTRGVCPGDSGADVVMLVDGRRDDRAATIDVVVIVVVIEDVDGRDGALALLCRQRAPHSSPLSPPGGRRRFEGGVARVDGRRDDRAATIDVVVVAVVVVIEDVDGRDGAERGDDDARRRTTADDDRSLCPCRRFDAPTVPRQLMSSWTELLAAATGQRSGHLLSGLGLQDSYRRRASTKEEGVT